MFYYLYIFWEPSDFKYGFLVPGGCDNVGPGLLLDPFDGGSFGPDHQTNDPVGHPDLDSGLTRLVGHQVAERQR